MAIKSRWKSAHDRFPAHVEEAKNSDGNVHRGYHLLEFRVAAELLRIGPVHSAEDYWSPSDWQLLLVVSEYMSALLEFLDWFWPDKGWEQHKQAIVLSKRLLQPHSPYTYPDLRIDPQLRAAWQSFTYCFWHGTRHLPTTAPPGEPAAAYGAARDWLTKLVGERGFEVDGHIASSLQAWVQATHPRLREAFPSVDWSRWPSVVWPDPDCACRTVEKRGALKRRQQEEDYAVRWPLRVTQGRPKFNHLKMEARDGFVVGIPSIKNPPALGFLAISDIMCAFKQATQTWPSAVPLSPTYAAQQDVVQSFVQNVLRETRGPLAPGIAHASYRYLGFVACCVLGWQSALIHMGIPLCETGAWGPQPLTLPGGSAALLPDHRGLPGGPHGGAGHHPTLGLGLAMGAPAGVAGLGTVDLGLAAQLALQPQLLPGVEAVEAALAAGSGLQPPAGVLPQAVVGRSMRLPSPPPLVVEPAAGVGLMARGGGNGVAGGGGRMLVVETGQGAPGVLRTGSQSTLGSQPTTPSESGSFSQQAPPPLPPPQVTRTRPSPFLARQPSAATAGPRPAAASPDAAAAVAPQRHQKQQSAAETGQGARQEPSQVAARQQGQGQAAGGTSVERPQQAEEMDGTAAMSLGGLSSMQDLIDGLPSHADLSWSTILGAVADEEGIAGAGAAGGAGGGAGGAAATAAGLTGGASAALGTALTSFSQIVLPSGWPSLRPPVLPQQAQPQQQPAVVHQSQQQQQQQRPQTQPQRQQQQQPVTEQAGALPSPTAGGGLPSPTASGLPTGLSSSLLPGFDSGLPCGSLQYPLCSFGGVLPPPRGAPDAPVHVHPPARMGSAFQGTVTTGSLPGSGMLGSLPRVDAAAAAAGQDQRLARRSHGEVFTLSPVASCGPNGETMPSSPAPADSVAATAVAGQQGIGGAVAGSASGRQSRSQSQEGTLGAAAGTGAVQRVREGQPFQSAGRRTRQDVAAAAAAAAADAGLPPALGSLVERSAKRPNAQSDIPPPAGPTAATAERVESLGAFLTDQQAGLCCPLQRQQELNAQVQQQAASSASAPGLSLGEPGQSGRVLPNQQGDIFSLGSHPMLGTAAARPCAKALGQQLLRLLRGWAEQGSAAAAATQSGDQTKLATAAAVGSAEEIYRRAADLLEQGASPNAAEAAVVGVKAEVGQGTTVSDASLAGGLQDPRAGYSALHWACLAGDRVLAGLLLRHGADPTQLDAAGVPARLVNSDPDFQAALAELVTGARQEGRQQCGGAGGCVALSPSASAPAHPGAGVTCEAGNSVLPGGQAVMAAPPVVPCTGGPRTHTSAFATAAATATAAAGAAVAGATGALSPLPTQQQPQQQQQHQQQQQQPSHSGTEAATAAGAETRAQLCQHLFQLLQRADQLAGQLAREDPAGAPHWVRQALQGTGYLSRWAAPGAFDEQFGDAFL